MAENLALELWDFYSETEPDSSREGAQAPRWCCGLRERGAELRTVASEPETGLGGRNGPVRRAKAQLRNYCERLLNVRVQWGAGGEAPKKTPALLGAALPMPLERNLLLWGSETLDSL